MMEETVSHYRIIRKLGEGGMGEVYLAEDLKLSRNVAIKFLHTNSTMEATALRRLLREAQAVATVDHPNICAVHEVNIDDDRSFIVMQYVEGETLSDKLQSGPLRSPEALEFAVQIADALAEAHARGIIHRDIKPHNIICTTRGQVKLMDFGLAKVSRDDEGDPSDASTRSLLTTPGTVIGTVPYMSPEQLKGEDLDARSDIFSFGVLLYEMLSGKRPFSGNNNASLISAILTQEPAPLSASTTVNPGLENVVARCLEKDRERRYPSADDLLTDLRSLRSGGQTLLSQPAGSGVSLKRTRPWPYVLALLIPLVIIAAVVYFRPRVSPPGNAEIHSIAILPFTNATGDTSADYVGDGITESLINSLSQLSQLKVIARTTAFRYKNKDFDPQAAGKELQVDAILTGKITQQGDVLSIQVDLLNTSDGSQRWGNRYTRRAADLFAVQEQIAREISNALPLKLTGIETENLSKRYTNNINAYQDYLQGQRYAQRRTKDSILTAIGYYEKAIQEDNNYALAYSGLTDAYTQLVTRAYMPTDAGRRKANEAAIKALSLDPNLAEAHASVGATYVFFTPHDFAAAERELRRAIELNPNLASAHQFLGIGYLQQGRLDEGLAEEIKGRELDPLSPVIARSIAIGYYLKRDIQRAVDELRKSRDLGPSLVLAVEAEIYVEGRLFDEALEVEKTARRERNDDPILDYSAGLIYAAQGRRAEALGVIKNLDKVSTSGLALDHLTARIYVALNDKEAAMQALARSIQSNNLQVFYKDAPIWDPLRNDKRFSEFLRRMDIP